MYGPTRQRRITAIAHTLAWVAATVLWSSGLFVVLPPVGSGLILMTAGGAALWSLAACRSHVTGRRFGLLTGTVGLAGAVLFPVLLFQQSDAVSVIRRSAAAAEEPAQIRLLSFNVLHGYPGFVGQEERVGRLITALRVLDPTVIVLQESWSAAGHGDLAARLGAELGYDVAYAAANGSRRLIGFEEGGAVLSRLPIVDARRIVLEPRRSRWRTRIALAVTLALGGDGRMTVVGVHLANGAPRIAAAQSRDLASYLPDDGLLIVAGDFNAPSDSPALRALTGHGLVDLVPGGIDHVLTRTGSSGWSAAAAGWTLRPRDLAELIGESAEISDHPGILVDLIDSGA